MFRELRFAARALVRWRGGALAAVVTLAIGIGTTTALYALVRLAIEDFPGVPALERVARIYATSPTLGVERGPIALNEFDSVLSHATSFEAIGAYTQMDATVGAGPQSRPASLGYASPGFFAAMGVAPVRGRVFTTADLQAPQPTVILSEALWRREFPDGRLTNASIVVDGVDRAVVGVMPRQFSYGIVGIGADLWAPLGPASRDTPAIVAIFARLRPGLGWQAAASELDALGRARAPWTWRAIPIKEDARHRAVGAFAFTLGPGLVVLLIGCVNVSCMLMARGVAREKELSVRRALGATRARVVRELLTENALLALVAGVLGTGLAAVVLRFVAAAVAAVQPAAAERLAGGLDLLPLALVTTTLSCVLFGTIPALRISRRDVVASLNGVPAKYRVHIAGYGARDLIVFFEVGSAIGLIVFAAMLFHLFSEVVHLRPTFAADRVVAVQVPTHAVELARERVAGVPGVAQVTVASSLPVPGSGTTSLRSGLAKVRAKDAPPRPMVQRFVEADFFETLGLPLVRGRTFDAGEHGSHAGVVILSETAARTLAPDADPLGLFIRIEGHATTSAIVIGVCRDPIDYGSLTRAGLLPPDIYVPYEAPASGQALLLARTSQDAHALVRQIAAAAKTDLGPRPPDASVIADIHPLGEGQGTSIIIRLLGGFSIIALLLAASGVFGVISQSVAQRTREFGIRMALGGAPRRVLGMVLVREAKLIAAALGSGAVITLGLTRIGFAELAALSATAPSVWFVVLGLGGGLSAIAVALATYRIVRLEPSVVLRRS